jgi:hypothetical protein
VAGWRRQDILDRIQSRAENLAHNLGPVPTPTKSGLEHLPFLKSIYQSL